MTGQVKKKLCWNCEGSVALHLENCPYCGVYLSPTETFEESASSLPPPYPSSGTKSSSLKKPPFQSEEPSEVSENEEVVIKESSGSQKGLLVPLLMFLAGTNFALFGLALWLFSQKGHLTLSWSDEWGPIFLLAALPLLFMGGRSLIQMSEDTSNL